MFQSEDTPPHIKKIQQDIWMRKTPGERLEIGLKHSDDMRKMRIAVLKEQYPDLSHQQIILLILKDIRKEDPTIAWLDSLNVWEKLPIELR